MSNSRYRWVIVAAGGLLGCVAIGAMFSLPVFLQPIARDTGWSVDRRVQRHDDRLPRDGVRQHGLGHLVRPLSARARSC